MPNILFRSDIVSDLKGHIRFATAGVLSQNGWQNSDYGHLFVPLPYGSGEITRDYWATHLSFAYNYLDPSLIIVSMGNFNGQPKQFAVSGNTPDPATVSVATGLLEYDLVDFEYVTEEGGRWDRISFAKISRAVGTEYAEGVALVEMLENRKIRFEIFPGKTAVEVNGFTSAARTYER